jgi:peptidyl-prolyl cis-trans isomerase SurA
MEEFENSYSKNLGGPANVKNDSLEAFKKFLDLYVNYKMKLRDAFVRGYTTDENMQNEILNYKANIGSTLFLEDSLYEPALRTLYEKRKSELRASHIFLIPDTSMNEEQTTALAQKIIDSVKAGADFAAMAKKYSKDTYTKDKGGDVYYFTAGQIAAPILEDVIYSLKVGEIYPKPVNSGFGIHVIKLTDRIDRKAAVQAQHILVSLRDSVGKPLQDTTKAFEKLRK